MADSSTFARKYAPARAVPPYDRLVGSGMCTCSLRLSMKRNELAAERVPDRHGASECGIPPRSCRADATWTQFNLEYARAVTQTLSSGSDGDRRPTSEAHAYPHDLARMVYPRWRELLGQTGVRSTELELLEQAISIAYQASLLQEEGRPVTFRVAFAEPDAFLGASVPSGGVHSFVFARRRPLDQHELRRLAPAASFTRSLIGATLDGDAGPEIRGLVHSGARSSVLDGIGQHTPSTLPPLLMVAVTGPGRLLVSAGTTTLAS